MKNHMIHLGVGTFFCGFTGNRTCFVVDKGKPAGKPARFGGSFKRKTPLPLPPKNTYQLPKNNDTYCPAGFFLGDVGASEAFGWAVAGLGRESEAAECCPKGGDFGWYRTTHLTGAHGL